MTFEEVVKILILLPLSPLIFLVLFDVALTFVASVACIARAALARRSDRFWRGRKQSLCD